MKLALRGFPGGRRPSKEQAQAWDRVHPLHLAVENQAPEGVVLALLEAHLGAAKAKNADGSYPLQLAFGRQVPDWVVVRIAKNVEIELLKNTQICYSE